MTSVRRWHGWVLPKFEQWGTQCRDLIKVADAILGGTRIMMLGGLGRVELRTLNSKTPLTICDFFPPLVRQWTISQRTSTWTWLLSGYWKVRSVNWYTWVSLDNLCILGLSTVRGSRPGKQVQLAENEIRFLCLKAREIFISQPILLDLEAPLKICGKYSLRMWNVDGLLMKQTMLQAIFMASIMIFCDYLNTAVSLPKQIISFWAIMSTEENNLWKRSACFWPTRSNTPRTSLSCEETTNVRVSTVFMDFTTNVSLASWVIGSCSNSGPK